MARKRSRSKYTWFPTIGTALNEGVSQDNVSGREFSLTVSGTNTTTVIVTPLTFDVPAEGDTIAANTPGQLAGIVGQEYFIRRIVGKLFAALRAVQEPDGDPSFPHAALFGAGFFVARASDNDAGGGPDLPIGAATLTELQENYSPLSEDTIREPWIWRRTWALGNVLAVQRQINVLGAQGLANVNPAHALFPPTTAHYGSIQDGPHIDAKTARRVRLDERLYFVVAAAKLPIGNETNASSEIVGYLDFRILAQLRRAANRGVF